MDRVKVLEETLNNTNNPELIKKYSPMFAFLEEQVRIFNETGEFQFSTTTTLRGHSARAVLVKDLNGVHSLISSAIDNYYNDVTEHQSSVIYELPTETAQNNGGVINDAEFQQDIRRFKNLQETIRDYPILQAEFYGAFEYLEYCIDCYENEVGFSLGDAEVLYGHDAQERIIQYIDQYDYKISRAVAKGMRADNVLPVSDDESASDLDMMAYSSRSVSDNDSDSGIMTK